jgi:hypothetical protein
VALAERLPKDACIRTTHEQRFGEDWTVERELMALLIEITSVTAAGKQLRKPIQVPRPKSDKQRGPVHPRANGQNPAYGRAVGVLASTARPKAVAR